MYIINAIVMFITHGIIIIFQPTVKITLSNIQLF